MTDNLEELERLLAKATPGEWIAQGWGDGSTPDGVTNIFNHDAEVLLMECLPVDDAALIVALRNAAPSLIATAREVEGLRAEVAAKSAAAAKQISDLAMQVGELRAENERLRALLAECPARHSMHGCPSAARAALGEAK